MASKKKPPPAALSPIAQCLHALASSGWTGFEGLVATLLQALCRHRLLLSSSGLQSGLDARSSQHDSLHVAIECKRYDATTPLSERELVSEIEIASAANPKLDLWVLATTRPVSVQEDRAMHEACRRRGIDYLTLDSAIPPNIGTLDALCVDQAGTALEFLATAGAPRDGQQPGERAAAARVIGRRGAPDLQEDVAGDLLGGVPVAEDAQREPVHLRRGRVVEARQRRLVAARAAGDQFGGLVGYRGHEGGFGGSHQARSFIARYEIRRPGGLPIFPHLASGASFRTRSTSNGWGGRPGGPAANGPQGPRGQLHARRPLARTGPPGRLQGGVATADRLS